MEKRKKFMINIGFYAIIGGAAIFAYQYILPVAAPFFVAFLLAACIQIPVKKWGGNSVKKKKTFAVVLCGSFYSLFFMAAAFAGAVLLEGAGNMIASAPVIYSEKIAPALDKLSNRLETAAAPLDECMSEKIDSDFEVFSENMGRYVSEFSSKAVEWISEEAMAIPGFLLKIVITIVATFFMAADFDGILDFLKKLIPPEKRETAIKGILSVKDGLLTFFKSYSLLFLLTFAELSLGFLVLGIPYALPCAFAIAVFDILPALGTGGILVPWAILLFIMGDTSLAAGMLVLETVITVIRNIAEPRIVGRQMGLHPLAALISMYVGLKLFGFVGLIFFPVLISVSIKFLPCPYTTV